MPAPAGIFHVIGWGRDIFKGISSRSYFLVSEAFCQGAFCYGGILLWGLFDMEHFAIKGILAWETFCNRGVFSGFPKI